MGASSRASFPAKPRATDAAGESQPLESGWNAGGYANNAVQRVAVTVGTEL